MALFKKVLVANRGEIALRVIRACIELEIPTVAIHSETDTTALYVKKADEAFLVGPGPVSGYLNIYGIIDLAKQMGVDAIHPGYGFLAENAEFAEACEENGITFIGPSAYAIRTMGNKVLARKAMKEAGIPIVPGIWENLSSADEAKAFAEEIGYPVILKAVAGGGGRGLRLCENPQEVERNFSLAKSEAKRAFGNDALYMEKYIVSPRHIEFQILADKKGSIIQLGERDCSIQRRHQKLIEIAPSLFLDESLRKEMGDVAVKAAEAVEYNNVGTVEFLMDAEKNYYFLEMNTRIQVEHTVTEEVTGIDIVKEMIQISAGEPLTVKQEDIRLRGYAIECRINAEDPMMDFKPNPGKITAYYSPGGFGVRIDGNVYTGYVVPPFYDSLLAKLTVRGRTWKSVVERMDRALEEFIIRGVKTTIPFYQKIMREENFRKGVFDTHYIDDRLEKLVYTDKKDPVGLVLAVSAAIVDQFRQEIFPDEESEK